MVRFSDYVTFSVTQQAYIEWQDNYNLIIWRTIMFEILLLVTIALIALSQFLPKKD